MATEVAPPTQERWQPGQYKQPDVVDFRAIEHGPKGFKERSKRKLEEMEALDQEPVAMEEDSQPAQPSSKRVKDTNTTWRPVSGKSWKAPSERAGKVMKPAISTSWEKKMQEKAKKQQFQLQKKEAADEAKAKRKAAADARRAAEERKKANQAKSAVVQKITNQATLKKMMKNKKQKKLLKTGDTN